MAANTTEQAVKDALRVHCSGLGSPLDDDEKQEIIKGRVNEAENTIQVDGDEFCRCAIASLDRHPVEWILK